MGTVVVLWPFFCHTGWCYWRHSTWIRASKKDPNLEFQTNAHVWRWCSFSVHVMVMWNSCGYLCCSHVVYVVPPGYVVRCACWLLGSQCHANSGHVVHVTRSYGTCKTDYRSGIVLPHVRTKRTHAVAPGCNYCELNESDADGAANSSQ